MEFQALPQVSLIVNDEAIASTVSLIPSLFEGGNQNFDATILIILKDEFKDDTKIETLPPFIAAYVQHNKSFYKDIHLFVTQSGHRVILTPLSCSLDGDTDDVRKFNDAVSKGIRRLKSTGRNSRLRIILPSLSNSKYPEDYEQFVASSMLTALFETHEQLQAREMLERDKLIESQIDQLELVINGPISQISSPQQLEDLVQFVMAVEQGRRLARDIGGSDPERMTAFRCAESIREYIQHYHLEDVIKCHVEKDLKVIEKEYPLLSAVARASLQVERHHPCVVTLEYVSPNQERVQENLFLVGKGVTYDTGGADLKVNGIMTGMSRDKCGAAAMAGFLMTVGHLQPLHLNVKARLAFVRNSIGPNGYVTDEIIKARSGIRVKVGNTDAEGRMAMADLLCEAKEEALAGISSKKDIRIITCATLTGHAQRTVGNYPIAMDNGPARLAGVAASLQVAGTLLGEPVEISHIRKEDFSVIEPAGSSPRYDVCQISKERDGKRGHQYPAAFLTVVSGLDKCGRDSDTPLAYTHLDIAGSCEESEGDKRVIASPLLSLCGRFLAKLGTVTKQLLP